MRSVDFHRTKYGRVLLVDAAYVSNLPGFDASPTPQVLSFYDVLVVTRGQGSIEIDGDRHWLHPGLVLFSRPGDVRRLRVRGLDGACFFFTADFITDVFADGRFLQRFRFFRPGRPASGLQLHRSQTDQMLALFGRMEAEIDSLRNDASEALRAVLYEALVLLHRFYVEAFGDEDRPASATVEGFVDLVDGGIGARRTVDEYAKDLGVTPARLSTLCRRTLGISAAAWIRRRIVLEARRLLLYSDLPAARVGERLGFDDPAYFSRFIKRETGQTPTSLRHERP